VVATENRFFENLVGRTVGGVNNSSSRKKGIGLEELDGRYSMVVAPQVVLLVVLVFPFHSVFPLRLVFRLSIRSLGV
jgi:hypothetical protein